MLGARFEDVPRYRKWDGGDNRKVEQIICGNKTEREKQDP